MKNIILILSLLLIGFSSEAQNNHSENQAEHKLIIQLVNGDSLSQFGLIKNLRNLTTGWPELQIEVVCHGPGIGFLVNGKSPFLDDIHKLAEQGVTFAACENTMKAKKIPADKISKDAITVPMGIQEVVLKQEAGWSYIKAGVVK